MNIYISKDIYNYINLIPPILYVNKIKITKSPFMSYSDYLIDGLRRKAGCYNCSYNLLIWSKTYKPQIPSSLNIDQVSWYLYHLDMNDIPFEQILLVRLIDRFFERRSDCTCTLIREPLLLS